MDSKYRISDGDMGLVYSRNDGKGFIDGYRHCEAHLIPQMELLGKCVTLEHKAAIERIEVLQNTLISKDKLLRDYRGMVDTSYQVVCEKNTFLAEIKVYLSEMLLLNNDEILKELIKRI